MKKSPDTSVGIQSKRVSENGAAEMVSPVTRKITIQKSRDDLGLKMSTSSMEFQGERCCLLFALSVYI